MELKRALELRAEYGGIIGLIKCDEDYICLNDLNSYFPNKRIQNWMANSETKELIEAIEKTIITGKSAIITKRGKGGGTYAYHLVALDFAAWLSVEFRIKIYQEYINGTQRKQDWNLKRILAAFNYKIMSTAINNAHDPVKTYHYSNEALMLNEIVFGVRESTSRDTATEEQLNEIAMLEGHNATLIEIGMDYQPRKELLMKLYEKNKKVENAISC